MAVVLLHLQRSFFVRTTRYLVKANYLFRRKRHRCVILLLPIFFSTANRFIHGHRSNFIASPLIRPNHDYFSPIWSNFLRNLTRGQGSKDAFLVLL